MNGLSEIRRKGLTLEMSDVETFYGDQFARVNTNTVNSY